MSKLEAIRRYDDFLLGKCDLMLDAPPDLDPVDPDFVIRDKKDAELYEQMKAEYKRKKKLAKEKDALAILEYAFRDLMGLSPQEALVTMQGSSAVARKITEMFRLDKVLAYIRFPPGIRRTNYEWLLARVFPNDLTYDEDREVLAVYRRVLGGELPRFPRHFFGLKGSRKLCVMLREYISSHVRVSGVEDLYILFRDPVRGNKILRKARLFSAYRDYFSSPLEFVHMMLLETGQEDPVLYNICSFEAAFSASQEEYRRRKTAGEASCTGRAGKTLSR